MILNTIVKEQRERESLESKIDTPKVDEEIIKAMSGAGCYSIDFGIESGNEKIRNEIINKRFSNAKISETIKLCNKVDTAQHNKSFPFLSNNAWPFAVI